LELAEKQQKQLEKEKSYQVMYGSCLRSEIAKLIIEKSQKNLPPSQCYYIGGKNRK
jgi:hypothetical protein